MKADRPALAWLTDARHYADQARRIAQHGDGDELDMRDYLAIRYCLMVVGEALDSIQEHILASEPQVPWRQVIALRHRLVHGYWLIDKDIIAEIAQSDTENLIAALDRLIQR